MCDSVQNVFIIVEFITWSKMVKSPIADVLIPNITVHELAYELFRAHRKKVAIVRAEGFHN